MSLYPLKCRPLFKHRIWGGRELCHLGKNLPANQIIGESWELADLPQDKTIIDNGPLSGQPISAAITQYPREFFGSSPVRQPFPLLIKFIDAQDTLSVQVHPDEETCRRMGRGEPKTECWYIMDAQPDAVIYKGLKPGVTRPGLKAAVQAGRCADLLLQYPVKPGQCHFLPSGTCHAIGKGILIAEVQQPSDTTYRLFDWNRLDPQTGQPRALHIEEALDSTHYHYTTDLYPATTSGRLVNCPWFTVDKMEQPNGTSLPLDFNEVKILVCLSGDGSFSTPNTPPTPFNTGDTFIIPAACRGTIHFHHQCQFLLIAI